MTDKLTVTLEGKEYQITVPLTLGQIQDCRVGLMLPTGADAQEEVRRDYKRGCDILLAALVPENPDFDADKLRGMRISQKEFNKAVNDVLDATGLIPAKPQDATDGAQGEAAAEAGAA